MQACFYNKDRKIVADFEFHTLQYLGNLKELWFYQKDMTRESTQIYYLNDLDYSLIVIEIDEKHRESDLQIMGNPDRAKLKMKEVRITPLDFRAKDRFGIEHFYALNEVAYFCIYANPVPPMPKYYEHETLHPLGIQKDTL